MEVANAYKASGTPMGYLVDADGLIASEIAVGSDAILDLVPADMAAGAKEPAADRHTSHNHPGKSRRPISESRIARDGLPAGAPAPDFKLPSLDGKMISLKQFRGRKLLLMFSDPQCGPCDAVASVLEQYRTGRPDIDVLIVSRGEVEANRVKAQQYQLKATIAMQRKWEVSKLYAMFATPVAYLIDEAGVLLSGVAVGADEILALFAIRDPVSVKEVVASRN
jgi:peroxiredoxin